METPFENDNTHALRKIHQNMQAMHFKMLNIFADKLKMQCFFFIRGALQANVVNSKHEEVKYGSRCHA